MPGLVPGISVSVFSRAPVDTMQTRSQRA